MVVWPSGEARTCKVRHAGSIPVTTSKEWKPVVGFEDRYLVSDEGEVWSLVSDRILKGSGTKYRSIVIDGKWYAVHRLVADTFLGPCPEGMLVRHWDDDCQNNRVSNLRYGTNSDNQIDAVRNGRNRQTNKTECPKGHPLVEGNLVPSVLARDKYPGRNCLTCSRDNARKK